MSDRNKLKDPNYKGEDYNVDKSLINGPSEDRRCTDIICYLTWLIFLGAMIGCSVYGYINGSPGKLLSPLDADGNFCGYSEGFEAYPYMYAYDINIVSGGVNDLYASATCVKTCPTKDSGKIDCKPTDLITAKGGCATTAFTRYDTYGFLGKICMPVYSSIEESEREKIEGAFNSIGGSTVSKWMADVTNSYWIILLCVFISLIYAFMYMWFLKTCTKFVAWLSIVLILVALIGMGAFAFWKSGTYPEGNEMKDYMLGGAILLWVVAALYVLFLACIWSQLAVSIAILEAAADFVGETKRVMFLPVFFFFIMLISIICWIAGSICLFSVGDISGSSSGGQARHVTWDQTTRDLMYFMFFGLLWIMAFVIAFAQFIIIVGVATWYFNQDSDNVGYASFTSAFSWFFRYHLGSIAFGSLIIAIVWAIRICFEYMRKKMEATDPAGANAPMRIMLCLCSCFLDCLNRFIKYINRNAYIQIALTSNSFCPAALDAFMLILKHAAKFTIVEGLGDVFMILGKMCIASVSTFTAYLIVSYWPGLDDKLSSPIMPCLLVFIAALVLSSIFISVYSTAANTILQCFLVDLDIADQEGREGGKNRTESLEPFLRLAKKEQ